MKIVFITAAAAAAAAASFWLLRKRTPAPDLGDSLPVPPPAQTDDLVEKIEQNTAYQAVIQTTVEEHKSGASEARKLEQECGKKQESLVPLEQLPRQKVTEITETIDSMNDVPFFRNVMDDNIHGQVLSSSSEVLSSHAAISTPPASAAVIPQQPVQQQTMQETEYRAKLAEVCTELEPLENELIEHKGKLDVACAESKLLKEKHNAGRETKIEENKSDASEARKVEQECGKKQESLVPLEQPTRQKVTEITNGRLGDLGSNDGFREFRIVRDKRAINSDAKPETPQLQAYGSQQAQITAPVKNSAKVLTKQKQSNATNPKRYTQGVKDLPVAGPPGVKNPALNGSKKPSLLEGSQTTVSGPAQKVQREVKNSSNAHAATTSTSSVIGVHLSSSDPVHVPSSEVLSYHAAISSSPASAAVIQQPVQQQQKTMRQMYPYCQMISPGYLPQMGLQNYLNTPLYPRPSTGSSYLLMPGASPHSTAGGIKYATSQYKPVPAGTPAGYGNFTNPAGFTINAPASTGAATGLEDVTRMKYKDNKDVLPHSLFFISADFDTGLSSYNPSKRLLLDSCNFCRMSLDKKRDIFMCRGDTPFCSEECRQDQIEIDEAMEKNQNHRLLSLLRKKIVTLASDYCWIPATSHYKPVPAGTSAGYGNFTYPAGFTINAPASTGADIWIQTPREVPGLQSEHPTFMPTHMPAHAGLGSFNASAQPSHVQYPGLYHRTQPGSIPNTHYMVHQQVAPGFGQGVGVGVGVAGPGPQVGTYQQPQATRIAYSADKEFRHVVTLDSALFEKPGTMSGGGGRPRGGRMGTCIKENISVQAVADANEEMKSLRQKISDAMRRWLRQKISDAMRRYQASEKVEAHLEMELAKCQKEIDSMNAQHNYLEKQLDSLKNDELSKLKELDSIISSEQKELDRLTKCSSKLRQKDTEIKWHKVKMATGQRMLERLTRGIEESKKERENLVAEKEKITSAFNNVRQEALSVQEKYMKTEQLIDAPNDVVDKTKADKLKKTMDELGIAQNYVEYKLHYLKHFAWKWEKKVHAHKRRLDDFRLDMLLVGPYQGMMDRLQSAK